MNQTFMFWPGGGAVAERVRPRADAARNRAAILAAARELIGARGPDVGMDEIAAAAGLAVGTLYRHFPTKGDLVGAIVADLAATIAEVLDAALTRIAGGGSTGAAEIVELLRRVVVEMGAERLLRDALAEVGTDSLRALQRHATDSLSRIVDAARADRTLHPDITVEDIALLLASSPDGRTPRAVRERWVELAGRAITVAHPADPHHV
jgi:AcrR family transcriptional regulator